MQNDQVPSQDMEANAAMQDTQVFTAPQQQANTQVVDNYSQQSANDDAFQTLMPTKNKYSLISYYLGFVGILPFIGFPFGVAAIIFGIKAMKLYKLNPTPGAKGHALVGIILGSISVIFGTLFGLFVVIGIATTDPAASSY